jgi:cell division transport system permease protein
MSRGRKNRRQPQHHWQDNLRRLLSPGTFVQRHAQVALDSLGRLYRNWIPTVMTAAVIAIALAMPCGLYLLLGNLERLSGSWEGQASMSIFLKQDITDTRAQALLAQVEKWPEVESVQLITPKQALEEFGQQSGFADVLGVLEENPLPYVLIVLPAGEYIDPVAAGTLRDRFSGLPETELAQLDLQWVQRLAAILDIAHRVILIISVLLALAVMLVVGNTIRLEIQNRREEILVTKLIGATNGFVRRPFLYGGIWYGVLGALIAWGVVEAGFWLLSEPVSRLAGLYRSDFSLETLPVQLLGILLAGGTLLGLLGSWLAVGRHLDAIEPS